MNILKNIKDYLPYIHQTIYVNFKYLPINQAIKLPIFIRKAQFKTTRGTIIIESPVKTGMIRIGTKNSGIHLDMKTILEISGKVLFKGKVTISNGSALSVGEFGELIFGNNFISNSNTKFCAFHHVEFGENTELAWDIIVSDTDFHVTKNAITNKPIKSYAPIIIGSNNWIGQRTLVLKGTKTPNQTIVSAGSVIQGKFKCEEKSIIGGNPAKIIAEGCYYRDFEDKSENNIIHYQQYGKQNDYR